MVANAHLDTQWNWDVQSTIRHHIKNTLTQNFLLFRQYPDYVFNFEGGVKYAWMKEYYPELYAELKQWVGRGRWHITGSSWDANETMVCSPEAWIRNILLGQTFYRQEFGTSDFPIRCLRWPATADSSASLHRSWHGVPVLSIQATNAIPSRWDCGRASMAVRL